MLRLRTWLLIALAAALAACGDNDSGRFAATATPTTTATSTFTATLTATLTASPTTTPTVTPTPVGAVALFNSDPLDPGNPFPSDRLLDAGGHVQVTRRLISADLPADARYDAARALANSAAGQITTLTGFSTFAPIRVRFGAPVTMPHPTTHEGVLLLQYDDLPAAPPITATAVTPNISGDNAIEIQPLLPLLPKTRYVYVITRTVLDAAGHPVRPAADLVALLHGTSAGRTALDPVLAFLHDQQGVDVDDIAAMDLFTTQPTTDDLISIRSLFDTGILPPADPALTNSPIPGLTTGIFPEGSPEFTNLIGSATSPNVDAVAIGSFDSYDFRTGRDGTFDPARVAGQVTPTVNHLDFYMTIPKAPPPPGGYPVVIFGHGLGGSGRDVVFVSQLIGDAPIVAIAISDVEHGLRGSMLNFFVLSNGLVTRERFRQTIADYLQLERMVRHATAAPFDQLDKSRIHYMGVSLGGIMGTLYMGVEPEIGVGMLSVPGGGLPHILQSPQIGSLLKPLISLTAHIPLDDPAFPIFFYRFSQLSQWLLDPADPINTAPYVINPARRLPGVPPKRILIHEGIIDDVVPNATTDDLALAMQLPDVKATHGCNATAGCSGIWRFVMTQYGQDEFSGHGVTGLIAQAGAQAGDFLATDGREILDAAP